jgi:hypothetical protein
LLRRFASRNDKGWRVLALTVVGLLALTVVGFLGAEDDILTVR